jgi:hypothetical protein
MFEKEKVVVERSTISFTSCCRDIRNQEDIHRDHRAEQRAAKGGLLRGHVTSNKEKLKLVKIVWYCRCTYFPLNMHNITTLSYCV